MKMSGKNSGIFFEILMRKSDFPGFTHFFILKKDGFKMKQTEQTEQTKQNKMATEPVKKLIRKMGLPMIVSMVLQALYNVVDSVFVANMQGSGALANEALTIAFPIQIMIIAVSVGTGVGLNAMLSKCLGERNKEKVDAVAGNGIFLCLVATGDCVRTRQNAAIFSLFVKFSLEVRQVRLRSPLPKIIKNIGVLVVDKSCLASLG